VIKYVIEYSNVVIIVNKFVTISVNVKLLLKDNVKHVKILILLT